MRRIAFAAALAVAAPLGVASAQGTDAINCASERLALAERLDSCNHALGRNPPPHLRAALHNQIGRIQQLRGAWGESEQHYLQAAKLDPRFRYEVIPLWDELEKWKEIVALAEPAYRAGNSSPPLLCGLVSAYVATGEISKAEQVMRRLEQNPQAASTLEDYRQYTFAFWAIVQNRLADALGHIARIRDPYYRRYMRTSPKFRPLYGDPEFQRLTR